MTKRVLLGGIVGGVVLFAWGAIWHMVLPLSGIGIRAMPNEEPVIAAMRENLLEPGFYFFPGEGVDTMSEEWMARYRAGPIGVLIYNPVGWEPLSSTQLLTELLSNIVAALLAAYLLGLAAPALAGYGAKAAFVTLLGLFPGLDVDVGYWNWYGFPGDYTIGVMVDHLLGWFFAGLVLAALFRRSS